jgi:hypothetical protein
LIGALLNGIYTESAKSGADGTADLPCLEGLRYGLEAHVFSGQKLGARITTNRSVPMVCGKDTGPFELRLRRVEP